MTYHPRFAADPGVAVVTDEVSTTGWLTLDLERTFTPLCGPVSARFAGFEAPSAGRKVHAFPARRQLPAIAPAPRPPRPYAKRAPCIPSAAMVSVASRRQEAPPARPRIAPAPSANDNPAPRPAEPRKRGSVVRQMFFLAVLTATLVGAYLNGRQHGYRKIILVPEPLSYNSAIT